MSERPQERRILRSQVPNGLDAGHPFVHPLDRAARVPVACIWEVTRACNLSCVHCDNHARRPSSRELSLDQLLGVARELEALGCRLVDLTGGEPLLMPAWDDLCRQLTSKSIQVALVTNGTLLDELAIERAQASGVGSDPT